MLEHARLVEQHLEGGVDEYIRMDICATGKGCRQSGGGKKGAQDHAGY